ncbi:MAG: glycosyltransferase [Mycobacteriales bacterium]
MVKRAVILTGSLGAGHDAAAGRVGEVLDELGWSARTLDAMSLLGGRAGRAGEAVFRRLIATGGLYDALHFAHLRTGSGLALTLDRLAVRRVVPALERQLSDQDGLLVATFPTGASAAARLAAGRSQMRVVVVCTDAVVHRLWVHAGTDLFIVTSEAAAASVRRYQPQARTAVVPMPLRAQFYEPVDRETARRTLGLPLGRPCVLVFGGGWGIGPVFELTRELATAGVEVLAVAGRNRQLEQRLLALAGREPRVHAYGFTDAVASLMSAADVVASAPGAASCAEARAVGRPIVLLDVLPGHGREAIDHELERGGTAVAGPQPRSATAVILAVLADPPALPSGPVAQWRGPLIAALESVGVSAQAAG